MDDLMKQLAQLMKKMNKMAAELTTFREKHAIA